MDLPRPGSPWVNGVTEMDRLRHLKNRILYSSLSKSLYREVKPLLVRENNSNMRGLAIITLVFGTVLSVLSLVGALSRNVLPAYLFLFVTSVLFLTLRSTVSLENPWAGYIACMAQSACLLTFGMLNSTVFAPDPAQNGTIYAVLLLAVPFLMIDVPWRMDILLALSVAAYCLLLRRFKLPNVVSLDTTNAVFVCLVSMFCNWVYSAKNMRSLSNRLYIEKERDSDPLTGLLTKKSARILTDTRLAAGGRGLFVIIDLDDFKHINDTYGHLYGDEVIKKVADGIKANTRRSDIASRFGGDEFTVFFPDMDLGAGEEKAETILRALRAAFAGERGPVTCSIGVAQALPFGDYNRIFEQADKALYQAKANGKDTYAVYRA